MNVGIPDGTVLIVAFVTLLFMDACWFFIAVRRLKLYPLFETTRLSFGLIAWAALAVAISTLRPHDTWETGVWGWAVGTVTYLVFNGTELAIRGDWTPGVALADTIWGMTACTTASMAAHLFRK